MMYSVIDTMSTILVTRKGNVFSVTDLFTEETVDINSSEFFGGCFKYEGEFLNKFKTAFKDKKVKDVILSVEASYYMTEIITFNRIDN